MTTEITTAQRVLFAQKFLSDIVKVSDTIAPISNVYIGIGHNTEWAQNDQLVETPIDSVDYNNQIFRNLVAIKKLLISDTCLVVRRRDWVTDVVYDAYSNSLPMFSTTATTNSNGTVTITSSQNYIIGTNTTFLSDYQ